MRILIYSYNYSPEPIGIAPLMTELAEGLVQQGHQVRVITAMPNYPERRIYPAYRGQLYCTEEHNGVTIQRCYVTVRPNPGLIARVLLDASFVTLSFIQALRGWRPDIILSTSPSLPACVPVALLRWLYGCPSVLSLQDILPEAAVETGLLSNRLAIGVFEILEKFAYRSATQIGVITEGFRANLLSKGVPNQKMVHIPNWVDVNFIRPLPKQPNAFRAAHGLTDKFVVLYSGNIARTQGIRTAIRAAQKLMVHPDIAFVIVGDCNQLGELQTLSQELGVNNITFLPFVPRADLPEMLAAADVGLILQKRNVVGFNMPSKTQVLLASGRPIVASVPTNGTAAQAVEASGGGMVVTPEHPTALANAILHLYNHPDVAEQLGKQGRQFALDNYSFAASLERYETLFSRLVNAKPVVTQQDPETVVVK
ncbi:Glycosyltransferase [Halomicronema hongdechloris C2206]|uniref:Glycosyltransferase n=1 Tax=Halomicronema hongdechloris C2206 TaxID=1641165 RepID=A0A1Z3HFN1_9CYAN|nr:glycosyltransferase family 4 protein [Halomicronema hongdechloris]ASC69087.1 Glycosyltransferase [Halomicronema hongdechloris C2206]